MEGTLEVEAGVVVPVPVVPVTVVVPAVVPVLVPPLVLGGALVPVVGEGLGVAGLAVGLVASAFIPPDVPQPVIATVVKMASTHKKCMSACFNKTPK